MWLDFAEAAATSDYQSPRLTRHLAGDALSLVVRALYTNVRLGVVVRGTPTPAPEPELTVAVDDLGTASVRDCLDATTWLEYRADTGELKDDRPGAHHLIEATVAQVDGVWKVTRLAVGSAGSC